MSNGSSAKVLVAVETHLIPLLDAPIVDQKPYWSTVGSLLYLTTTRPDIMFSVFNCARYQVNPRQPHINAINNIFQYLNHTMNHGVWYPMNKGFFHSIILGCWSRGLSCRSKKNYRRMLTLRWETRELAIEKVDVSINFDNWGWIHCCCGLYISSDTDPKQIIWLCVTT